MAQQTLQSQSPLTAFVDKRAFLALALIVGISWTFWSGSRYPDINEKAAMGGQITLDALGFNKTFVAQPDDPVIQKILFTTGNWIDTNLKGMAFGILLAAAIMSLVALFKQKSFRSGIANSALGMIIGAPLGVCVNCAAPIALGMHSAGMRLETTISAMISSPTLNVLVLAMMFSLFPVHMIVVKVGLTIFFVLLVIPLICRIFLKKETSQIADSALLNIGEASGEACEIPGPSSLNEKISYFGAVGWIVKTFTSNLWFIVKKAVPLMLLAGLLGAALITVLPWDSLSDILPAGSILLTLASMSVVALVGLFLPVPITFDVIIVAVLTAAGLPVKYGMTLLFTLGIFSCYSYFIVWRAISPRAASILFVALTGLGVVAGVVAHEFDQRLQEKNRQTFLEFLLSAEDISEPRYSMPRLEESLVESSLTPDRRSVNQTSIAVQVPVIHSSYSGYVVFRRDFESKRYVTGSQFTRHYGHELGVDDSFRLSFYKTILPFSHGLGRAIATGDVNRDSWQDILLVSEKGIQLYRNEGGTFSYQPVDIPTDLLPIFAALVDVNNDGWLDIVFSTFRKGTFLMYSEGGEYHTVEELPPRSDGSFANAIGFGDIDRDGDLDIVLGEWRMGPGPWQATAESTSRILINQLNDSDTANVSFLSKAIVGEPGAPLSILISDYNDDGNPDMIIGMDFAAPDGFYLGDGLGNFSAERRGGRIPHSTHDTMSVTTTDINNDLRPEIFLVDVSRYPVSDDRFDSREFAEMCDEISDVRLNDVCQAHAEFVQQFMRAVAANDISKCFDIPDEKYAAECVTIYFAETPNKNGGPDLCELFPAQWADIRFICEKNTRAGFELSNEQMEQTIPQQEQSNVLLMADGEGNFVDRAKEMGLNFSGFSWNARFADLDNDEWQDLFVVNGILQSFNAQESNYFFRNINGSRFENLTDTFGLSSYLPTSAYSYVDYDNDGDLDIVTVPVNGPVTFYENTIDGGNSIAFGLQDEKGNSYGIGSKIIITYGGGRRQMRELQASGGILSYDAPVAYFGLGVHDNVDKVEIEWLTGDRAELVGDFSAGALYTVVRQQN